MFITSKAKWPYSAWLLVGELGNLGLRSRNLRTRRPLKQLQLEAEGQGNLSGWWKPTFKAWGMWALLSKWSGMVKVASTQERAWYVLTQAFPLCFGFPIFSRLFGSYHPTQSGSSPSSLTQMPTSSGNTLTVMPRNVLCQFSRHFLMHRVNNKD